MIWDLNLKSWRARGLSVALTIFTVAISVTLILGLELTRAGVRKTFSSTAGGVDLIVGARSDPQQLFLSTLFQIGNPTSDIRYATMQEIANRSDVSWVSPISLGDNHRGFRVLGTETSFFKNFRHRGGSLEYQSGKAFNGPYQAVLGAGVAGKLNYKVGESLVLTHGLSAQAFQKHGDTPFSVSGVLAPTNTPFDNVVFVSLAGIDAIHNTDTTGKRKISAFLLGVKSKITLLTLRRDINQSEIEPLTSVMPSLALQQFWENLSLFENAFLAVGFLVVLTSLLSVVISINAALDRRRREMAVLRAVGARPRTILSLFLGDSLAMVLGGLVTGLLLTYGGLYLIRPFVESSFGIFIPITAPGSTQAIYLAGILFCGFLAGLIPAARAYYLTLHDGLHAKDS